MDVIVTGLPRSGLTVVSALIDYLPDAICLNAPLWHVAQARKTGANPMPYCKWLVGDFAWTRMQLLREQPIRDFRAANGVPLLDAIRDPRQPKTDAGKESAVLYTRPGLKKDFILGMKHHGLYSAVLPQLAEFEHFKIIAVIRHPLDVIHSWRTLTGRPLAQGRLPVAARFWPEVKRISDAKGDTLERMTQLYDAHIERYHSLRDKIHILKYEDVVADPMVVSKALGIDIVSPGASLIEQRPRVRISEEAEELREHFKKYGVFTRQYYPKI